MQRIAEWRGKPNATTYPEALQVFALAKLSRKDVFYDLGCGYGWVCIWAARRCKAAIGIESHRYLAKMARKNVEKRGLKNVRIINGDFDRMRFQDADLLYCIAELGLDNFRRWGSRKRKRGLRIVTLGPPPIPIKPAARKGLFYLTRFPYSHAKTGDQWCSTVMGKRRATLKDVEKRFKRKLCDKALRVYQGDFKKYFANS
jgi:SAM-dependent methyltransferase